MKCVICQSTDIEDRVVNEAIWVEGDLVLVPCQAQVCNACGERYYDRHTMQHLEAVERRLRGHELTLDRVGHVLQLSEQFVPALAVRESQELSQT